MWRAAGEDTCLVEAVEDVRRRAGRPRRPTSTSARSAAGRPWPAARAAPDRFVAVVHVVGRGRHDDAGQSSLLDDVRAARWPRGGGQRPGRRRGRGRAAGPRRPGTKPARTARLLRLGPPAVPLALRSRGWRSRLTTVPAAVAAGGGERRGSRRPRRRGAGATWRTGRGPGPPPGRLGRRAR